MKPNVTSAKHKTCDPIFFNNLTSLHIEGLKDCALTVPASLKEQHLAKTSENVTISGTKGVKTLVVEAPSDNVSV